MAGGPEATGGRTIDVLRRQLAEARAERDQARAREAALVGELRESEARHALVSDAVAEGIYEWNIEDNALWVSQRLIGIFGFEGHELTARDWNELVHPEDFPGYRNALRDCFKGTTRRLDCEYRVKHADGAYRWVEDRAVPVRNATGQALRLVGAVSDVTARKEDEQALREALEQRTATAEVLEVINASPGNLAPVFDAMLEKAMRLCRATFGILRTYDGSRFHSAASHGVPAAFAEFLARNPQQPQSRSIGARIAAGKSVVHVVDVADDESYPSGDPHRRALIELGGARTTLVVALAKDRQVLGAIQLYRQHVQAFSNEQIALLQNFAAQAVIAMENARLIDETREALEQQTATAQVLQAINSSPGNLAPVFSTMLEKAMRLCRASFGELRTYDGARFDLMAARGVPDAYAEYYRTHPGVYGPGTAPGRILAGEPVVHIPDLLDTEAYRSGDPDRRALVDFGAARASLVVPLRKDTTVAGYIMIYRQETGPFSDKQVALLQSFAAQAVIAIENARLLTETREALEQQTATTEVLQTINASPGDLQPVFDAIVGKAMALCGAAFGMFNTYDGQTFHTVATRGVPEAYARFRAANPPDYSPQTGPGRLVAGEDCVQIADMADSDLYRNGDPNRRSIVDLGGARTILNVALRKESKLLGMLAIYRQEVRPFSDKEIALLQTFAAQAVIAMENARLLTEQREALEQQTATAEVLKVISESLTDVQPVLDAVATAAIRFCGAEDVTVTLRDGDELEMVSHQGPLRTAIGLRDRVDRTSIRGRSIVDGATIHVPDIAVLDPAEYGLAVKQGQEYGFRSNLTAPMLREGTAIGCLTLRRAEPGAFTPRQIQLLETFAAQAVIAIENVRLFTELSESLDQQTATAEILRVISQSPTDVQPVLHAVTAAALRFCGANDAQIALREGDDWYVADHDGPIESMLGVRRALTRQTAPGAAILDSRTVHYPNVEALDPVSNAEARQLGVRLGFKSALCAPMLRDGVAIGAISLRRPTASAFTPRQIELLESFAAQAVIALENTRLFTELRESLDQQTATADILRIISQSPTDVQPVLDAVASAAVRFCGAEDAAITLREDDETVIVAHAGPLAVSRHRSQLDKNYVRGRAILEGRTIHVPDLFATDEFPDGREQAREWGHRAVASAPLLREGEAIGCLSLQKPEPTLYTDRQILLLEAFAAQAVIAIENTRLFTELRQRTDDLTESLEYQTATSEVLEVIGRSTSDIQPVLDTMLSAALHLCRTESGGIAIQQGDGFRYVATLGWDPEADRAFRSLDITAGRGTVAARVIAEGRIVQVADVASDPEFALPDMAERAQWHTALGVPLMRDGRPIGVIAITRDRVEAFTERQVALVKTFADQAVIAMENARLLGELRQRTDDLTESLEYQTATSEVLGVISRSPITLQPVLEAMTAAAVRLCGVKTGGLSVRRGDRLEFVALVGQTPEFERWQLGAPIPVERGVPLGDAILDKTPVQIVDVMETEAYKAGAEVERAVVDLGGHRTILHVPLLREDEAIGVLTVSRGEPLAFTERQIGLIKTFADQAVIAMENARLLSELRQRTDDLQQALEYQTAIGEVLTAISRSTFDLAPVLETLAQTAMRLCDAEMGFVCRRDGEAYRVVTAVGATPEIDANAHDYKQYQESRPILPDRGSVTGRVALTGEPVQIADATSDPEYRLSAASALGHIRTQVGVPLIREGALVGVMIISRQRVEPFTDRQIGLLKTFADQAVIAMENARLLGELRESLDQQTATAEVLAVINSSPGDLAPVFECMLEKAHALCQVEYGSLQLYDGAMYRAVAVHNLPEALAARLRAGYAPGPASQGLIDGADFDQTPDIAEVDDPMARTVVDAGIRTLLRVALRKDGKLLGQIVAARKEVRPFSDKEIALLQSFASQGVIAIENARLLSELHRRTDDLTESLEYQTATSELLEVISRSSTDIQPVFDTMLRAATRLCDVQGGAIAVRQGDVFRFRALLVGRPEFEQVLRDRELRPGGGSVTEWVMQEKQVCHVADIKTDPRINFDAAKSEFQTLLGVPMLREGDLLGVIVLTRREVEPFIERQIALIRTFADQAVIAMENARLLGELRESLERQTATAEVLQVINASPGDVQPVFEVILAKAMTLCNAAFGTFATFDGERLQTVATRGVPEAFARFRLSNPPAYGAGTGPARLMAGEDCVHDIDAADSDAYRQGDPSRRAIVDLGGARTILNVALRKDGALLGSISIYRQEVRPFSDNQIALLQGFAGQAVIAMENARLLGELRESLDQQTATSDVLSTISRSSVDLSAVLNTLVETVGRLCRADQAYMFRRQDDLHHLVASHGASPEMRDYMLANPFTPHRGNTSGRALLERRTVHISDVLADPEYTYSEGQKIGGFRTMLGIPLMREDAILGVFVVSRTRVEPFTDKEIALASGFADQAVIALENARLFEELTNRQAELRVTFDNMGDGVVMFDADLRLASWNRNFQELLDVPDDFLASRPGLEDYVRLLVQRGELGDRDPDKEVARYRERAERQWSAERTRPDGRVLEVRNNPVPGGGAVLIYSDITRRKKAEAEIRAARDAAEAALERQTATADILKVIASSPIDVQPVLEAVVKAAVRFCGATDAMIQLRDGDSVVSRAHEGPLTYSAGVRRSLDRSAAGGRAIVDGRTCHLPDIETLDPADFATLRRLAAQHGFRATVAAPLKREDAAVGAVVLRKVEPGPFTRQQIELLETFAAQAVIAIENVRLFTELRDSLERLRAAQANLVQSEKMASLGQLTAGIAHEIKNPLNFVNNFASLSVELLDELKEAAGSALATLDEDKRAEVDETMELLVGNLQKIAEHGKRADGIVKSMLSHSRGGTGDWTPSDINALVEEALNLAYHGARAQDKEFNVTLERDFAKESKPIEVVPQDVTRVFLNLFGNGFYAANKRRMGAREQGFRPTIKVSTRDLGEAVEVRVRDNGIGIPPDVRDKLFQPFFTTKPTGEGTGLGLSISYDIVTQQHGGTIEVESEPGHFTEFTVRLPRARRVSEARGS